VEDLTEKMFISTQGPTKSTFYQFWKMVFINKSKYIMMLCNLFEDTRVKCDQYWPEKIDQKISYNNEIEVILISEEKILDGLIIERKILIQPYSNTEDQQQDLIEKNSLLQNEQHYVTQFHVTCWPDHSVPEKKNFFKLFDFLTRTINENYNYCLSNKIKHSPTIVHCSAGIGRTGTLISIYNIFDHLNRQLNCFLQRKKDQENEIKDKDLQKTVLESKDVQTDINNHSNEEDQFYFENIVSNTKKEEQSIIFSVFSIVRKLREQRFHFVTDLCQYKIIYKFAYSWIRYYWFGVKEEPYENCDFQVDSPVPKHVKPYIKQGEIIISLDNKYKTKLNRSDNNIKKIEGNEISSKFILPPTTKSINNVKGLLFNQTNKDIKKIAKSLNYNSLYQINDDENKSEENENSGRSNDKNAKNDNFENIKVQLCKKSLFLLNETGNDNIENNENTADFSKTTCQNIISKTEECFELSKEL
jgi:protein tyrosine phosphatase